MDRNKYSGLCRHCKVKPVRRPRGLCWACYYSPGIRASYPSANKFYSRVDQTKEEVDRIVEEQMKCLPEWWDKENGDEKE